MRTLSALLCMVVLVAGISGTSISDKYTALKSRHSLSQIMLQVESMAANKLPIEEMYKLYLSYTTEIKAEQASQQELYDNQSKECEDEFSFRTSEVAAAEDASQKSSITLNGCTAQKDRADIDHNNTVQQISETENYLANLIETRNGEAAAFDAATEVYKLNSEAAGEALEILEQIWSGEATFLELAKHANTMLKNAIAIKKVHKLTPVMAALAQLASKKLIADDSLLKQVQQLLREFRVNIENDYTQLEANEQAAIAVFNDNKARTEEFLAALAQAKSDLEVEQSKLNFCISNQTSIKISADAKLQRNQDLLDSAVKMCDSFHREFVSASEARRQELELIEVIKAKVVARFGGISAEAVKRIETEQFAGHNNESAYATETAFEHSQAAYDENGATAAGFERDATSENF